MVVIYQYMPSYDIKMTTDDTLELDTIIKNDSNATDPITKVETSSSYNLTGIQTKTAVFDPEESGEYDIHINGQVLSINVTDASAIPDFADWTVKQGSPTVSGDSVTLLANDDAVIYTDFSRVTGSWSWDFVYGNGIAGDDYGVSFIAQTINLSPKLRTQQGYTLRFNRNGTAGLKKNTQSGVTTLLSFGWDNNNNQHSAKVTRDSNGNFEVFYDGVSQGTAQDTTFSSSSYILIGNDTDVDATVSNLTFS